MTDTRRQFLAVAGSLVSLSLAGCIGDDDDDEPDDVNGDDDVDNGDDIDNGDDGDDADDSDDEENGTDEEDVSERIAAAESHIGQAGDEIETMLDQTDPVEGDRLDVGPVEQPLDMARAELDAARPHATADELETIDSMESLLEFLDGLLGVLVEFDNTMAEFNVVDELIAQDRWEEAIEPLERTDDAVTATRVRLDDARATFETVDADPLDGLEEIELAEMEVQLDELDEMLFALDGMVSGLVEVARGLPPFGEGATALDEEAWDQAQASLAEAAEHFGRAEEIFEETAADASAEFHDDLTTFACQWGHLRETAEHFENATVALSEDDDETAQSELDAAEDALALADQC